jgi:hypothetical protein
MTVLFVISVIFAVFAILVVIVASSVCETFLNWLWGNKDCHGSCDARNR